MKFLIAWNDRMPEVTGELSGWPLPTGGPLQETLLSTVESFVNSLLLRIGRSRTQGFYERVRIMTGDFRVGPVESKVKGLAWEYVLY